MAKELNTSQPTSGLSITARLFQNGATVITSITCSEVGTTRFYSGDMPTITAGTYQVVFYTSATTPVADGLIAWNGSAEILVNDLSTATTAGIADAVWDEVLTGATHNINASAGKRLRQLASNIVIDGEVVSATSNTVTLDAGASSDNGAYDPALILITEGPGAGESRLILSYNGSTKTCVLDRDWKFNPTSLSKYVILSDPGREHVNEGLAQGGTATSITLNTSASASDGAYIGQTVFIRSGTGSDQARRVISYNGTTKVATVQGWSVTPDTTSAYVMLPTGSISNEEIASAVWDEILDDTTHDVENSAGRQVSEMHLLQGLRSGETLTVTPTSRTAGAISQTIGGDGTTTTTVSRD